MCIGIGHAAIDGGGSYTYLNTKTGTEFSATLGFTKNFENYSTRSTSYAMFSIVSCRRSPPSSAARCQPAARATESPRAMCCSARARRGAAKAARRTFSERCNGKDALKRRARCISKVWGGKSLIYSESQNSASPGQSRNAMGRFFLRRVCGRAGGHSPIYC